MLIKIEVDPILVANLTSDFPGLAYNYSDIIVSTLLIIQDFNWLFAIFIIFFSNESMIVFSPSKAEAYGKGSNSTFDKP